MWRLFEKNHRYNILKSDIDIALLPEESLPPGIIALIKEELEEGNILRQVEIVGLRDTDETSRQRVIREGVLWKE